MSLVPPDSVQSPGMQNSNWTVSWRLPRIFAVFSFFFFAASIDPRPFSLPCIDSHRNSFNPECKSCEMEDKTSANEPCSSARDGPDDESDLESTPTEELGDATIVRVPNSHSIRSCM
jgi:hypothetical protein